MDKSSELDCYLYFMWNQWDSKWNDIVFHESANVPMQDPQTGDMVVGGTFNCANHFWNKWCYLNSKYHAGAPAVFYSELSPNYRRQLVDAAVKFYNK